MRQPILIAVAAIFLIGSVSCNKPATSTASTANSSSSRVKPVPAWPGKITLTTDPAEPASGQDIIFHLTLTDPSGQPVSGAKAEADLVMPLMDMGKNVVPLADKGNGVYEGKGQLTMSGPWNVIVSVSKAEVSGEQKFDLVARK